MYDKYSKIPGYVIESKLCSNAKILYGEISLLCHKEGFCYANNKYFSKYLKVTERTITRILGELEDAGFIRLEYCKNRRKIYLSEASRVDANFYHNIINII